MVRRDVLESKETSLTLVKVSGGGGGGGGGGGRFRDKTFPPHYLRLDKGV